MPDKIKVLVIDDATFMVKALTEMLDADPGIEVVGSAKNGMEALEKIKQLRPDVVTLDVDMPVMDGIKTVRHIMIECQVPIVMLSSLFSHGEITFEALRLGVVDFMPKPSGAISKDIHDEKHKIIERVKIASDINIDNVRRVRLSRHNARDLLTERYEYRQLEYLIVIGTTLGGPNTVINMMSHISPELPAAIIIVQEIAPKILPAFVNRFNEFTPWRIEEAKEGSSIEQGVCYISSYSDPVVVGYDENHEPCLVKAKGDKKPLNEVFDSAAMIFEQHAIGVLLAGVGDDGTDGFFTIKEKAGTTIAQEIETCVYPNLSNSAIQHGVVDYVSSANDMSANIENIIKKNSDAS
ncbi:MAG: response regulator [Gammaproteobacteria bacterium]|nr:response regulator [Gammaproteobacteria bacterium]